jgi:hypothetical protein
MNWRAGSDSQLGRNRILTYVPGALPIRMAFDPGAPCVSIHAARQLRGRTPDYLSEREAPRGTCHPAPTAKEH